MLMSSVTARDTFLVDTATGQIWQRVTYTDLKGQPDVWQPMAKFDTDAQLLDWLNSQPRTSNPTNP